MASHQSVTGQTKPAAIEMTAERARLLAALWRGETPVVLVALLAHGGLLLNQGIYWDDWIVYTQIKSGAWANLTSLADQLGGIPTYLYIWVVAAALPPEGVGYKFLAFALIIASGLVLLAICRRMGFLTPAESVLVTCLAVAYPADHTHVLLITVPYLVYWFSFLLGVLLMFQFENAHGVRRWVYRIGALVLLFFGFGLNSLLAFYFGVLALGLFYVMSRRPGITARDLVIDVAPKRLDFILLPFVFWLIYRIFFPPNGIYSYYHQFVIDLPTLQFGVGGFLQAGLLDQLRDSLLALIGLPLLWLVLVVAVYRFWPSSWAETGSRARAGAILAFGFAFLVLAVVPYIVVGLAPSAEGWSSRHTILLGVPVALIVVSSARLLFAPSKGQLSAVGAAVIVSLLAGFVLDAAQGYIGWEARWLTDSSFVANLAADPAAGKYSVYWIRDDDRLGGEPSYRFYEWSALLTRAYGGQTRVGVDATTPDPAFLDANAQYFNSSYGLAGLDPSGCEAVVTITRGPTAGSQLGMVAHYFIYSLTDPAYRGRWLAGLTAVSVQAVDSPRATSCPAR